MVFTCTWMIQRWNEEKNEIVLFTVASKRSADLNSEKYKTLKEIKCLNKLKDVLCSWIKILDKIEVAILKIDLQIQYNLLKSQLTTLNKLLISKNSYSYLRNSEWWEHFSKRTVGGLTHPEFRTYQKAAVIKIVWCWHRTDLYIIYQWDKIENPEINLHFYSQFFDKSDKTIQQVKEWSFWMVLEQLYVFVQENKRDPPTSCYS